MSQTAEERTRPQRSLSDTEIVAAARAILAQDGVEGLTMRRLSTELQVALGATYHHVRTKHDLLLMVAHELFDEAAARPMTGTTWEDKLVSAMRETADRLGQYPGFGSFVLANVTAVFPTDQYVRINTILREEGGLSEEDALTTVTAMFFYVGGMIASGFAHPSTPPGVPEDIRERFEAGLRLLLEGARSRAR